MSFMQARTADHVPALQLTNSLTLQLANFFLAPLALIFIRAEFVLCCGDWIVRQSILVDAGPVGVSHLLVGGTVALEGAFLCVLIVLLLCRHRRHLAPPLTVPGVAERGVVELAAAIIAR